MFSFEVSTLPGREALLVCRVNAHKCTLPVQVSMPAALLCAVRNHCLPLAGRYFLALQRYCGVPRLMLAAS